MHAAEQRMVDDPEHYDYRSGCQRRPNKQAWLRWFYANNSETTPIADVLGWLNLESRRRGYRGVRFYSGDVHTYFKNVQQSQEKCKCNHQELVKAPKKTLSITLEDIHKFHQLAKDFARDNRNPNVPPTTTLRNCRFFLQQCKELLGADLDGAIAEIEGILPLDSD